MAVEIDTSDEVLQEEEKSFKLFLNLLPNEEDPDDLPKISENVQEYARGKGAAKVSAIWEPQLNQPGQDIDPLELECDDEPLQSPRKRKCQSCIELKAKIESLKTELAFAIPTEAVDVTSRPKPGFVPPEIAGQFDMIEIFPHTGVYWYDGQREAVLLNCKEQPEQLMGKTIEIFFDKNTLKNSSARGQGQYPPLPSVILDACLRFVQHRYDVEEARLIKVVNDKCSHYRRPKRVGLYNPEKYQERKRKRQELNQNFDNLLM